MAVTGFLFAIGFIAMMALALLRHPIWGLYGYIAVFYLHPPSRWWGAFLPDMRWSLVASAVTLIALLRVKDLSGRPSWLSMTPARILIAFTVWLWIQSFWALNPLAHNEAAVLFTKYIVLFYLIYRLVQTGEELRRFMLAHIAGCFYLGWIAFTSTVSGRLEGVGGPGIDEANALGMHMGTGAMAGAMIILVERKWVQWLTILAMAFILNTLVLSGSRGSFLSLLCAGMVLLVLKPPQYKRLFYGLAVLGVALMLILAPPSFWERMETITAAVDDSQEMDTSAESRFVVLEAQVKMARAYPFGAGHRGTEALSTQYIDEKYLAKTPGTQRARSSHNTFMTTLVEQGIPGAIMFLWMVGWCVRCVRRLRRYESPDWGTRERSELAFVAAGLTIVLIAGLFVDYLKAEVAIWLLALLAVLQSLAALKASAAVATQQSQLLAPSPDKRPLSPARRS
ncbi:MAG TPA: O-antigen ligase family protein [Steroidobacteraceae bacterium]|nr:O-antigen ligase family protein [Steroidobacteraceae bacterium]